MSGRKATLRRVQSVRKSFTVYLPREWCERNAVRKGSEILAIDFGKSLVLVPVKRAERATAVIQINGMRKDALAVKLFSACIEGADRIEIVKSEDIILDERYFVRSLLKRVLGMDVIEESGKKIVIKEVALVHDAYSLITRAFQAVEFLIEYLATLIDGTGRKEVIEEVETEVDRFRIALERRAHKALSFTEPAAELTGVEALHSVQVMRFLERIADHVREVAKELEGDLEKKDVIKEWIRIAADFFRRCREAYEAGDEEEAAKLTWEKERFKEVVLSENTVDPLVVYHLTRIVDYVSDISEVIVDVATSKQIKAIT